VDRSIIEQSKLPRERRRISRPTAREWNEALTSTSGGRIR
jgi:hypothetical protein